MLTRLWRHFSNFAESMLRICFFETNRGHLLPRHPATDWATFLPNGAASLHTQRSKTKGPSSSPPIRDRRIPSIPTSDRTGGGGQTSDGLDQQIYDEIHHAIIGQQLPPGTKLGEEALCGIFGVNRPRIRKILQRLAYEQLLDLYPNRGAFVAQLSVKEAREIFGARRLIEPSLIESAAGTMSQAQIKELQIFLRLEREAQTRHDRQSVIRISGEFHLRLAKLSGNSVLTRILRQLISRTSLIIAMYEIPGQSGCNTSHHEHLVSLLEAHETQKMAAFMREHLQSIESSLRLDIGPVKPVDLQSIFRPQL
jgi:DNA-binding GntR family transcriptional regulator